MVNSRTFVHFLRSLSIALAVTIIQSECDRQIGSSRRSFKLPLLASLKSLGFCPIRSRHSPIACLLRGLEHLGLAQTQDHHTILSEWYGLRYSGAVRLEWIHQYSAREFENYSNGALTPRLSAEASSNRHSSYDSRQEIFRPPPSIHCLLRYEEASSPKPDFRAHLQPFFEPSQHHVIILAFVVQVPACGCGGESVGVLCSKTHACGFASMRDTQCGASEESNGGSCWEAEFERNGETIVVI